MKSEIFLPVSESRLYRRQGIVLTCGHQIHLVSSGNRVLQRKGGDIPTQTGRTDEAGERSMGCTSHLSGLSPELYTIHSRPYAL